MSTHPWRLIEKNVELPTDQKFHGLSHDGDYEPLTSDGGLGIILAQVPMSDEEWAQVESLPQVKKVYEGGYAYEVVSLPMDFKSSGDRDLDLHKVKEAHQKGFKGKGRKAGVIDTGFDEDHFRAGYSDKILLLKDFTVSASGYWDKRGHGTHVMGTILDDEFGVAPEAKGLVAKALGDNGSGSYAAIIKAIDWLVAQGVDVINMSLSGKSPSDSPLSRAADAAADRGVHVVCAAGNDGCSSRTSEANSPANAQKSLAVAAVDTSSRIASFSSCGSNVDIAGAGVNVLSLGLNGNRSTSMSGTSMASPHVAGTLLLSGEGTHRNREAALLGTAIKTSYDAIRVGSGIANALDYVMKLAPVPAPTPEPAPPVDGKKNTMVIRGTSSSATSYRVIVPGEAAFRPHLKEKNDIVKEGDGRYMASGSVVEGGHDVLDFYGEWFRFDTSNTEGVFVSVNPQNRNKESGDDDPLEGIPRVTRWDASYGGRGDSLAVVTDWQYKDMFLLVPLDQAREMFRDGNVPEISPTEKYSDPCGSKPTLSEVMKFGWEDRKAWKNCKGIE